MAKVAFPITVYNGPDGLPLSNGYLLVSISNDAMSVDGQLCYQLVTKVPLDNNGQIIGALTFFPNNQLNPLGTYYIVNGYTSAGQLVLGPVAVYINSLDYGFGTAFGDFFGS